MATPVAIKFDLSDAIADRAHQVTCLTRQLLVAEHSSRRKEFQRITVLNRAGKSNLREPCAKEKSLEDKGALQRVPHHRGEAVR